MVVGESGLGKSTLVNSMFLTDIYASKENVICPSEKTVKVESHHVVLEEGGVKLSLNIVDTPGFGDGVDNTNCWDPIIKHVDEQFNVFLEAETRVNRVTIPDNRIHVCLYFIAPSGHGLKSIDVEFMRRLHDKVRVRVRVRVRNKYLNLLTVKSDLRRLYSSLNRLLLLGEHNSSYW